MKRVIGFLLFVALAVSLTAQNTVLWRNDRSGIYHENGLLQKWPSDGPQMLWHFDQLGDGFSSVAIDNNLLYITGTTDSIGYIYKFDLKGKLLQKEEYGLEWTKSYPGSRATVTINDGHLYVVSGRGFLICFDVKTLKKLWSKDYKKDYDANTTSHGIHESPLIIGDKLILSAGGTKYNILALNKKDGSTIWNCEGEGDLSGYCSPIYIEDTEIPQVVTMMANHIIGVDVSNGKKLWSFPHTNRFSEHPNTPIYWNGMIFCTSSYGKGSVMLKLQDGGKQIEKVWESSELDVRTGHMIRIGNYIYGAGDKANWYCIDWKTGKQMYKDNTLAPGAIIANNDMLYCYTAKGEMALVKATAEKFDLISKFSVTLGTAQHWAHPVIYQGIMYVRHGNTLMAYKIK